MVFGKSRSRHKRGIPGLRNNEHTEAQRFPGLINNVSCHKQLNIYPNTTDRGAAIVVQEYRVHKTR